MTHTLNPATARTTKTAASAVCLRMSRNFADIDHALSADPSLYNQTHLLSVSFDPAYAPGTLLLRIS